MAYSIRPCRDEDAEALAKIIAAAIREIGPRAYSPAQVAAWSGRHRGAERYRERVAAGDVIIVAADHEDRPVAYVLLQPDGHLDHLYNHPAHTRRGLASRLLAEAERQARARNVARLYTEASDLARPSFERAGFVMTHRREFEIDGVPIHNWAMDKALG